MWDVTEFFFNLAKRTARSLFFCLAFGLVASSAFATAIISHPHADLTIQAPIFPSSSPLSAKYEKALYSKKPMFSFLYKDAMDDALLAAKNRDKVWAMGQKIIDGILSGAITSKNITSYMSPELKASLTKQAGAGQMVEYFINHVKAEGSKAKLSSQYIKGQKPDYMVLSKNTKSNRPVIITIVHINDPAKAAKAKKGEPISSFTLSFSARKPYTNWQLAGLWFRSSWKLK